MVHLHSKSDVIFCTISRKCNLIFFPTEQSAYIKHEDIKACEEGFSIFSYLQTSHPFPESPEYVFKAWLFHRIFYKRLRLECFIVLQLAELTYKVEKSVIGHSHSVNRHRAGGASTKSLTWPLHLKILLRARTLIWVFPCYFCHFIHSSHKYFLSFSNVTDTLLGTVYSVGNTNDKIASSVELIFSRGGQTEREPKNEYMYLYTHTHTVCLQNSQFNREMDTENELPQCGKWVNEPKVICWCEGRSTQLVLGGGEDRWEGFLVEDMPKLNLNNNQGLARKQWGREQKEVVSARRCDEVMQMKTRWCVVCLWCNWQFGLIWRLRQGVSEALGICTAEVGEGEKIYDRGVCSTQSVPSWSIVRYWSYKSM